MLRVMVTLIALIGLYSSMTDQEQKREGPPSVSSDLPTLPPPPDLDSPPPPPPPPLTPVQYPKRYQFVLPVGAALQGAYLDFQLPPGQIRSVQWVAVGPGQLDVSNAIDVAVISPSLYLKPAPSGASLILIESPGANVRLIARRKNFVGVFQVSVSIDLGEPK